MNSNLLVPLFVQLELTEGCNHRCGYCSNFFSNIRSKSLSVKDAKIVLDELLKNEVFSVVLTGGEPFINKKTLDYTLDRLSEEPIEVFVNTNLSQELNDADLKRLQRVEYVLVSFPSHNPLKFNKIVKASSFEKVINNLELLSEKNVPFGINQVVTPENYEDVNETVKFLKEKFNIKGYSASPVIPTCQNVNLTYSISPEQVLKLASDLINLESRLQIRTDMLTCIPPCFFPKEIRTHRIASHGCSAGRDSLTIGADGQVRRCALIEESYGSILEESLKTIWEKIKRSQKPISEKCVGCRSDEYCYGGCEVRTNLFDKNDPYVKGGIGNISSQTYIAPKDSTILTLKKVRIRKENQDYLVGNGECYVFGNSHLVSFVKKIEGMRFTLDEVKRELGTDGTNLVMYLFNRGLLKECDSK
jgi:radical SAM protein with 4Fe4S-binding SPASM domain